MKKGIIGRKVGMTQIIDEKGNVIDGDIILAAISNYMNEKEKLNDKTLVATIMSSIGLKKYADVILKLKEGESFLKAIGYKQLMQIEEKDTIYRKDNLLIATKDIKNGEKLTKVETVKNDNKLNTIEKLINEVKKLEMPLDTKDFFVKKAEIKLKKIL